MSAPDFGPGLDWLNTDAPVSLADLKGKVVVVDVGAAVGLGVEDELEVSVGAVSAEPEAQATTTRSVKRPTATNPHLMAGLARPSINLGRRSINSSTPGGPPSLRIPRGA